jgi:hypothetical protein
MICCTQRVSEYGNSGPLGNFDNLHSPRYNTPTQNDYSSEDVMLTGGTIQNEVELSRENDESNALNSFDNVSSWSENASTIFEY